MKTNTFHICSLGKCVRRVNIDLLQNMKL